MRLESIHLQNFYCYYDSNVLKLKPGLNVILGENGEGKTKLFEGVEWLLSLSNRADSDLVSAKKFAECQEEDSFIVSIEVVVDQYDETISLKKYFTVTKSDGRAVLGPIQRAGHLISKSSGESLPGNFDQLILRAFPQQLRKYMLFKGEDQLKVFEDESSLKYLLELFSDAKSYDRYSSLGRSLKKKAESAVEREAKKDRKIEKEYRGVLIEIEDARRKLGEEKKELRIHDDEVKRLTGYISDAERFVENAEDLEKVNKSIESLNRQIREARSRIKTDYTSYLFDEYWIIAGFNDVYEEFKAKVSNLNHERRRIEREALIERGRKEAVEDVVENGIIPLNYDVPNPEVMEELIKDRHCKVCNTPAPEGSPQLEYMVKRLNTLLEARKKAGDDTEDLWEVFANNINDELRDQLSWLNRKVEFITSRFSKINEWISFNASRESDVKKLLSNLEKSESRRKEIIGESAMGEERLATVLQNYNDWQKALLDTNNEKNKVKLRIKALDELLQNLNEKKSNLNEASTDENVRTRLRVLEQLSLIFEETKHNEYLRIVNELENISNEYFKSINRFSFSGTIKLQVEDSGDGSDYQVDVFLIDVSNRRIRKPNKSLETSCYISVLFAINEMAKESVKEQFPIILDAPTSSFGETKTGDFIKVISDMEVQMVILLKDFIEETPDGRDLKVKDSFFNVLSGNAAWLKLDRENLDKNDISTLSTRIIDLS